MRLCTILGMNRFISSVIDEAYYDYDAGDGERRKLRRPEIPTRKKQQRRSYTESPEQHLN